MKKLLYPLMFLFIIGLASASFSSLGIFKLNDNVELIQLCADCTYNNITSVRYPNGTRLLGGAVMTKQGSEYNYTLLPSQITQTGEYIVNGIGDPSATDEIWAYTFEVTESGELEDNKDRSAGLVVFGFIMFITIVVFYFGMRSKPLYTIDTGGKRVSNFIWQRGLILIGIYLMSLNASIINSIVVAANLGVSDQMLFFMEYFGFIALVGFIWYFLKTLKDLYELAKEIKLGERVGDE